MANQSSHEFNCLKAAYIEDMKIAQIRNSGIITIPQYLGQLMGEQEWNESVSAANKRFINVGAYDMFKNKNSLILVGRIGTGKSSILKKMEYDVNNHKIPIYKDVIFINLRDYILQLASYGHLDGTPQVYAEIEENLKNFIMLSIMKHIVYDNSNQYSPQSVKIITNYLNTIGVSKDTNLGKILDLYIDKINNDTYHDILQSISMFSGITKKLFGVDYHEAEKEVNALFTTQKMLVLVDTLPEYNFNDVSSVVIVKTLMIHAFDNFSNNSKIAIKIAMPSELYSDLSSEIPAKFTGNTVFIEWRYRDLVKFIAMRCYFLMKESEWKDHFSSVKLPNMKYENLASDYEKAKDFLQCMLPERCNASINLSFNTLSYIIRHTQKKPRQLMKIFESIIYKIIEKESIDYFIKNPMELKNQIHYVQNDLISDCLNMYANTYKGIVNLCTQILKNSKYCMTKKELEECIDRECNGLVWAERKDIKKVLIESGIIGTYNDGEEHYIDKNNTWFKNPNIIKIIPVLYEYQVKGRLIVNENSLFVVHPMCYEYYRSKIDYNCLVYPESNDESDETYEYFIHLND